MTTRLQAATAQLLSTVDRLPGTDWGVASECAGWSRAHVIAHLALNAEALAGVLRGVTEGRAVPMYAATSARDADIATLAGEPPAQVRERLRTAITAFDDALVALGDVPEGATFERTPGGQTVAVSAVPGMRLREVEIHHADLRAGYSPDDWPAETSRRMLASEAARHQGDGFVARATDVDEEFVFGDLGPAAPVVSGPLSALAWWATGRDAGSVVSSSTGTLPTMEGR